MIFNKKILIRQDGSVAVSYNHNFKRKIAMFDDLSDYKVHMVIEEKKTLTKAICEKIHKLTK